MKNKNNNDDLEDIYEKIEKKIKRKRIKQQSFKFNKNDIISDLNHTFSSNISKQNIITPVNDTNHNVLTYNGIYDDNNQMIIHINFKEYYQNIYGNSNFCDKILNVDIEENNNNKKVDHKNINSNTIDNNTENKISSNTFKYINTTELNKLNDNEKVNYLNSLNLHLSINLKDKNLKTILDLITTEVSKLENIEISDFAYFLQHLEPYMVIQEFVNFTSIGLHLLILKCFSNMETDVHRDARSDIDININTNINYNNDIYTNNKNTYTNTKKIKLFYKITNKILYSINILSVIDNLYIKEIKKDFEIFKIKEYLKHYRLNLFRDSSFNSDNFNFESDSKNPKNDLFSKLEPSTNKDIQCKLDSKNSINDLPIIKKITTIGELSIKPDSKISINDVLLKQEPNTNEDLYLNPEINTYRNLLFKPEPITNGDLPFNPEPNNLLHSKYLYYTKKYVDGFLLIKDIKNIFKYKLMYKFNKTKCLELLKDDLYTYKHFLFYIQCIGETEELYEECVKKFNNLHTQVAYLRYLKFKNLNNGVNECNIKELDSGVNECKIKELDRGVNECNIKDVNGNNNFTNENGSIKPQSSINNKNNNIIKKTLPNNTPTNNKYANNTYITSSSFTSTSFATIINEYIFYEQYIIKRKTNQDSYKHLSKSKKRLIKKNLPHDLIDQEMRYLENKPCNQTNKFYYLYLYKKMKKSLNIIKMKKSSDIYKQTNSLDICNQKKSCKIDIKIFLDLFKITHNGDILIILYIFNISIEYLYTIYSLYNVRKGFYWCRVRNIEGFEKQLEEGKRLLEFDQNYD